MFLRSFNVSSSMIEIATWIFMIDDKISQRTHSVTFFFCSRYSNRILHTIFLVFWAHMKFPSKKKDDSTLQKKKGFKIVILSIIYKDKFNK